MNFDPTIPLSTLRDAATIVAFLVDRAAAAIGAVVEHLADHVSPPLDVRVVSSSGALYTGIIVVRRSEIFAGAVFVDGYRGAPGNPPPTPASRPLFDARHPSAETSRPGYGRAPSVPVHEFFDRDGEDWR